jgi:hypothetical protein
VRNAVPVEHFLLLLRSYAVVLVEEVKEWTLGLLKRSVCARLEIAKVGEDAFLELLRVLDRTAERLKAEG